MQRTVLIAGLLICLIGFESFAQKKKGAKDLFRFGKKKEQVVTVQEEVDVLDPEWFELDEDYLDSLILVELECLEAKKQMSVPQVLLSYGSPVQIYDWLEVDSVWLSCHDYYHTWSSTDVNPYDLDGENFHDSVSLPLVFKLPQLESAVPVIGEVTSPFGLRRWRWHYGDDIRLRVGDTVRAAFDGIVRIAKYDRYGYGNYVLIRHYNGLETLYGHLQKRLLKVGDVIKAGEVVGLGGNTGRSTAPHLHFEVRYQGNAIDPKTIFDFDHGRIKADSVDVTAETFSYLKEARKIRYHRVRSGDTLSHISYRYGVPINTICRLNGIRRSSILRIGQRLRIT